jgi:hypothetical protein
MQNAFIKSINGQTFASQLGRTLRKPQSFVPAPDALIVQLGKSQRLSVAHPGRTLGAMLPILIEVS